jgi:hypothetical protein
MSRFKKRITFFQGFVIAFILYFGIHMIVGFTRCINTDYATCPGHDAEIEDEESVFDD